MTNRLIKSLAAAALFAPLVLAVSCKKDDNNGNINNNGSNTTKILGSWTKTFHAADANGNNTIDASEKTGLAQGEYEKNTYGANSLLTDSSTFNGNTFTGTGAYTVNGDYLTVSIAGFTASDRITQLDDHNLVLQDTSRHPNTWTGFTK